MKNSSDTTAIVLAAGRGVRMNSDLPKVLHQACGKSLIYHVLSQVVALKEVKQIVIVAGYKAKLLEQEVRGYFIGKNALKFEPSQVKFVYQPKVLGTAHAVLCAKKAARCANSLILCADTPLIQAQTLRKLVAAYLKKQPKCLVITANMPQENSLGRIVRDDQGKVRAIQEKITFIPGQAIPSEVNSGMYLAQTKSLFRELAKVKKNPQKQEYFFTDVINLLYQQGMAVDTYQLDNWDDIFGVNTPADLWQAQALLQARILETLTAQGVKIFDPKNTYVAAGVKIGKGSVIYPFTFIEENVIISDNCLLGPFLHIRPGSCIKNNVHIGNFIEINRSVVNNDVRIKHFSYIGDAQIGSRVNIGAGTVIANYDGKNKHQTIINQDAFIGSDSVLVAPLNIGKSAMTAAGSVVTHDVAAKTIVAGVPARVFKKKQ